MDAYRHLTDTSINALDTALNKIKLDNAVSRLGAGIKAQTDIFDELNEAGRLTSASIESVPIDGIERELKILDDYFWVYRMPEEHGLGIDFELPPILAKYS